MNYEKYFQCSISKLNNRGIKTLANLVTIISAFFICGVGFGAVLVPDFSLSELRPGGNATSKRLNTTSFIVPGQHLSLTEQMPFWNGLSFFRDPWVIAPASTTDRDGLGPLYNSRSCITCHRAGSRGPEAVEGLSKPTALLIRLLPKTTKNLAVEPNYGDQIQPLGIAAQSSALPQGVSGEADVVLHYQYIEGEFADGTKYQLRKPEYQLANLAYGKIDPDFTLSARYAPNLFGVGLLDAIAEADIVALADEADDNQDGISGKAHFVLDATGVLTLGRFGFKAKHPTLRQQVAAAFVNDIGITNPLFSHNNCQKQQSNCLKAVELESPTSSDINDRLFNYVVDFNRHLAVPPARQLANDKQQAGRNLFYQAKCHQCHQPSFITSAEQGALSGQTIWPYSDLLLHDLGDGLADQGVENRANGNEWRTAPLWGIGLQQQILGKTRLLHDGRARSIMEAILWHGGEAQTAKERVLVMSKTERDQLISFLSAI